MKQSPQTGRKAEVFSTVMAGLMSILLLFTLIIDTQACTTFKLNHKNRIYYGHNLDSETDVEGMVVFNPSGILKQGRSFEEYTHTEPGKKEPVTWISRFSSITFNNLGVNMPDGGMNEAGLVIWEMTLQNSRFAENDSLPKLFMMVWIQYVLDNCRTVTEVIDASKAIMIDGWNWHFFCGTSAGECAVIEHIEGKLEIRSGSDLPVPFLGNAPYCDEIERIKFFKGYGGHYKVEPWMDTTPGMLTYLNHTRKKHNHWSGKRDALRLLRKLWGSNESRWSVVFEPVSMTAWFRTDKSRKVKRLSLKELSITSERYLYTDIHTSRTGRNLTRQLQPLMPEVNKSAISDQLNRWWGGNKLPSGWAPLSEIEKRFASLLPDADQGFSWRFSGNWSGIMINSNASPYPDTMNIIVNLSLFSGIPAGTISSDDGILERVPVTNFTLDDEQLSFTFRKEKAYTIFRVICSLSWPAINGSVKMYRDSCEPLHGTITLLKTAT